MEFFYLCCCCAGCHIMLYYTAIYVYGVQYSGYCDFKFLMIYHVALHTWNAGLIKLMNHRLPSVFLLSDEDPDIITDTTTKYTILDQQCQNQAMSISIFRVHWSKRVVLNFNHVRLMPSSSLSTSFIIIIVIIIAIINVIMITIIMIIIIMILSLLLLLLSSSSLSSSSSSLSSLSSSSSL